MHDPQKNIVSAGIPVAVVRPFPVQRTDTAFTIGVRCTGKNRTAAAVNSQYL